MKKIDFSDCEFIHEYMRFYTYNDFCNACHRIKSCFDELPDNGKKFYMWYIYANTHMSLKYKNVIWDYLNEYKTEEDLNYFKQFYGIIS